MATAFKTSTTLSYASDFINNKKHKHLFCKKPCNKTNYLNYNNYYLNKNALIEATTPFPVNKSNLIAGQYTTMELLNVCTASPQIFTSSQSYCDSIRPLQMNVDSAGNWNSGTSAFYEDIVIDPNGELFGRSQCGELNFTDYMVFTTNIHNKSI